MPRNDDWKVFLEILRNKPDLHVKPEEVVTKLVAQEAAIKREKGMSVDSDVLLFAKTQRKSQARKNRKGRSSEKDTESDSDSSDEKRGRNAARRPKDRECYECHEIGHIARFCPRKRSAETTDAKKRSAAATDTAAMATTIEHYFLTTTRPVSSQPSDWFVDGGCTAHICGERKQFIRYTEYKKSEEHEIGDFAGRVAGKAIGYGDVRLRLRQPGRRRASKVVVVRNVLHVEGAHNALSQSMLMD